MPGIRSRISVIPLLLPTLLLVLPISAQATTLLGETEVGQRSTSEDYDGEDQEDDYHYLNGHINIDSKISDKLTTEADASRKTKDYETLNDLDNQTDAFTLKPTLLLRGDDQRSLKADFRTNYRRKRYENQPRLDYNQIALQSKFTLQKTSLYSISALAGWQKYYYPAADNKDQSNLFETTEGSRYFFDQRLNLRSAFRIGITDVQREGKDKTKFEYSGGAIYRLSQPWIDDIEVSGGFGKRDSKDTENQDEDLDFTFSRYRIKTDHVINPSIKAAVYYERFQKDYKADTLDFNGYDAGAGLDWDFVNDKESRSWTNLDLGYRNIDFLEKQSSSYGKLTPDINYSYQRKQNWKITTGFQADIYDYDASLKDKTRYTFQVGGDKYLLDSHILLSLLVKYKLTDYAERKDQNQDSVKLTVKYRF